MLRKLVARHGLRASPTASQGESWPDDRACNHHRISAGCVAAFWIGLIVLMISSLPACPKGSSASRVRGSVPVPHRHPAWLFGKSSLSPLVGDGESWAGFAVASGLVFDRRRQANPQSSSSFGRVVLRRPAMAARTAFRMKHALTTAVPVGRRVPRWLASQAVSLASCGHGSIACPLRRTTKSLLNSVTRRSLRLHLDYCRCNLLSDWSPEVHIDPWRLDADHERVVHS